MINHKKRKKVVNVTALLIVTILVFATFFSLNITSSFGLSEPLPPKTIHGYVTYCNGGGAEGAAVTVTSSIGTETDTAGANGYYTVDIGPDTGAEWTDGTAFTVTATIDGWSGSNSGTVDGKYTQCDVTLDPPALQVTATASPTTIVAGETVDFTGSATGGAPPYTWFWDFDGDGTSTEEDPTHTFNSAGTFDCELTVTDSCGNTDTANVTILVIGESFIRGDVAPPNAQDGSVTMGDGLMIIGYYIGDTGVSCLDAADVNDDGSVTMGDGLQAIGYYIGDDDATPMAPFPACGPDPTDSDGLGCDCHSFCMDCSRGFLNGANLNESELGGDKMWLGMSSQGVGGDEMLIPVFGEVKGFHGMDLDAVTITLEWNPSVLALNSSLYEVSDPVFDSFSDMVLSPDVFNVEVNNSEGWAVITILFSYTGTPDVSFGTYRMCDVLFDVVDGEKVEGDDVWIGEKLGFPLKSPSFTYRYWSVDVSVSEGLVSGDMNGNGILNSADVRHLALYLCGDPDYKPLYDDGDVNSDGRKNSADVRYLALYLCGDPDYSPLYP